MNLDNLEGILDLNKVIILLDRGYPSTKLFCYMISKGIKFICRLPSNYYKHERKWMKTNDELLKISVTNQRVKNIEDEDLKKEYLDIKYLNLRLTEITNEIGTKIFISNLNFDFLNTNGISDLYGKR